MKKFVLLSIIIIFFYSICYSEEKSIYNFDANENLFTAYAFMNAAGYNHDWSERICTIIAGIKLAVLSR